MDAGGKGSFQAFKLQRSARTTVCSHSTRDMAAMRSIESKHNNSGARHKCLSSCEQSWRDVKSIVRTPGPSRSPQLLITDYLSLITGLRSLISVCPGLRRT
jgi:hypothetical protein